MKHIKLKRMWFNQPSKLQEYHNLHGTNVLVNFEGGYGPNSAEVFFLEGETISMIMDTICLSPGWIKQDSN